MKYFLYALCLALIVLKLTGFIDWSWWLVWLPVYGFHLFQVFLLIAYVLAKPEKPKYVSGSKFQQRLDDYMEKQRNLKK